MGVTECWSIGVLEYWIAAFPRQRRAPKGLKIVAQGLTGFCLSTRYALKALPTPRTRGAIPKIRNTPILRYSKTPLLRSPGFEDEDDDEDENENEAPGEG